MIKSLTNRLGDWPNIFPWFWVMSKIVLGAGPPVRPPAPCVLPDADAHSKKGLHKRHDQRRQEEQLLHDPLRMLGFRSSRGAECHVRG